MGELQGEYSDRVEFQIVSAEDTAKRQDEIEEFGFTELKHGLVTFDASGEPAAKLPGHQFGKEEIRAAIETALQ